MRRPCALSHSIRGAGRILSPRIPARWLAPRARAVKAARLSLWAALLPVAAALLASCASQGDNKAVVINQTAVPPLPTLEAARVGRGTELYAQYCSECHGANLEGALDWKLSLPDGSLPPPPHDDAGHTWHHPDALLLEIIAQGGDPSYNSRMPAFGDDLSQDEIASVLDFIKSRWGTEARQFQWWITATSTES